MRIENEFTVDAPVDRLWAHLLDVERIAPCMPGAELTETVDDRTWKGKVNVRFGPVSMAFAGTVTMEERDDDAKRVRLHAKGTEQKGKGAANAVVTSWLEPAAGGETLVKMEADITLTGAAAQLSRGLLPEVSRKLTQQFADCLHDSMQAEDVAPASAQPAAAPGAAAREHPAEAAPARPAAASPAPPAAPGVAAKPVGGIRLGLSAIWSLIVGFFRRLFGGGGRG
ncbi:MAG TPA: SRPBCC family protein [Actinomycetota bacterium]